MYFKILSVISVLVWISTGIATAENVTYDFSDPKNVNAVSIVVDSMLEPNTGFASPVKGTVTVDTQTWKIVSGSLSIPTTGVTMSNSTMTKALHSSDWLDAEKNPEITFNYLETVAMGAMTETEYHLTVVGSMTIGGETRKVEAPLSLSFSPGKLGERNMGSKGDLMVLRSKIPISRKAFNIKPSMPETIVGDTISLTINLAGFHPVN